MKSFGFAGLKRFLVTVLLGIGLVLLIVPGAIAVPVSFSPALMAQTAEVRLPDSPQPSSTPPLPEGVEKTAQPEQTPSEQRPIQDDQQQPVRETPAPRDKHRGDRPSTQTPYDPYDMNAIRQFDQSWYGQ